MLIRYGYEITLTCQQPTALVCLLSVHEDRVADIRMGCWRRRCHVTRSAYIDLSRCVRQPLPAAGCAGWRPDHVGRRNNPGQRTTGQDAAWRARTRGVGPAG